MNIGSSSMTLDTLTRYNADEKHQKLKNSLSEANGEFRERFKDEKELFRCAASPVPLAEVRSDLRA